MLKAELVWIWWEGAMPPLRYHWLWFVKSGSDTSWLGALGSLQRCKVWQEEFLNVYFTILKYLIWLQCIYH